MRHAAFAVFYHLTNGSYQEGVGDRSVCILDGRESLSNRKMAAAKHAQRYGYDGFRIARGEFTNPFFITAAVIPTPTEGGNNGVRGS